MLGDAARVFKYLRGTPEKVESKGEWASVRASAVLQLCFMVSNVAFFFQVFNFSFFYSKVFTFHILPQTCIHKCKMMTTLETNFPSRLSVTSLSHCVRDVFLTPQVWQVLQPPLALQRGE